MKYIKIIIFSIVFYIIFNICNYNLAIEQKDINIYSPSALIIERSTLDIIYEKNAYKKMYPASLTKIMTAIITLENCNLTDKVIVNKTALESIPEGYSVAHLVENEQLTIEELLNLLLIASSNDAANVLAEHVAGSIESFSYMMNVKAKKIGCINTRFVNPSGIHDINHYSTAFDLALIANYAMNNDIFRSIVTKTSYTLNTTNKSNSRFFYNTNELVNSNSSYYFKYCIGIKTGYTNYAGECLISCAKKDDLEFISVVLNCNTPSQRFTDSIKLLNFAINNFSLYKINESNTLLKREIIENAETNNNILDIFIKDEITILKNISTDINSILPIIEINLPLKAPIEKNSVIGKITYSVNNKNYSSDLIAGTNINEKNIFEINNNNNNSFTIITILLSIIFIIIIVILIIILIIKIIKKKKNNKYKLINYN